jgi:hypothetical protein
MEEALRLEPSNSIVEEELGKLRRKRAEGRTTVKAKDKDKEEGPKHKVRRERTPCRLPLLNPFLFRQRRRRNNLQLSKQVHNPRRH